MTTEQKLHIFVVGLEPHQRQILERLPAADGMCFHALIPAERLRGVEELPIERLYREGSATLAARGGPIDGIIALLDFPATEIAALLARDHGLPGPPLEAILRCNHKYWSRLLQEQAAPQAVPRFYAFDPFHEGAIVRIEQEIGYPCWVKPVNAYRSMLGFRADCRPEMDQAVAQLRQGVQRLAEPFAWILEQAELPEPIKTLPPHICLAEQIIGGHQCTLEGYLHQGEPQVYAVIDSIQAPNGLSFARYQYPSALPQSVQARMSQIACQVARAAGLDQALFNVELFHDKQQDQIWLLEINPRLSQSHCELLEKVDGVSHQQIAIDLALGRTPRIHHGDGEWPCAAKFFVRAYRDGRVIRVPGQNHIAAIEQQLPGVSIQLHVNAEEVLSQLADQDSYSYELASIWIGGHSTEELEAKYQKCEELLGIEVDYVQEKYSS